MGWKGGYKQQFELPCSFGHGHSFKKFCLTNFRITVSDRIGPYGTLGIINLHHLKIAYTRVDPPTVPPTNFVPTLDSSAAAVGAGAYPPHQMLLQQPPYIGAGVSGRTNVEGIFRHPRNENPTFSAFLGNSAPFLKAP